MSLIAGSLISAGASLLGGIFGSNSEKKAIARQNEYNKPINVRARAEEGGFNPLLFVGPGVGQQTTTGGTNYIGQGIANAGLALADGMDKQKMLDIEKAKLAQDQQKLDVLIQNATIRPKSGGIYAGNLTAPSAGGVGSKKTAIVAPLLTPIDNSTSRGPVDVNSPDFTPKNEATTVVYQAKNGQIMELPVAPDPEEIAAGAALEMASKIKASPVYAPAATTLQTMWTGGKSSINPSLIGANTMLRVAKTVQDTFPKRGYRRDPAVVKNDAAIKAALEGDYYSRDDYTRDNPAFKKYKGK